MRREAHGCFSKVWLLAIALGGCIFGCGKRDLKTGIDTEPLAQVFSNADPVAQALIDQLKGAITSNRYTDAVITLRQLGAKPQLNADQRELAKNLMYQVQEILAKAADRGDTNALRAIEEYERRTRGAPAPR